MGILRVYVLGCWTYASAILTPEFVKANILIDQTGNARLADFGLLTIISDPTNLLSTNSYTHSGTARWMSPELIYPPGTGPESGCPTIYSDCYALGMVIYEIISGHVPFYPHPPLVVFAKVTMGERPFREVQFTDDLWKMLERCWAPQPNNRPSIEDVLLYLGGVVDSSELPYAGTDEETEDSDDRDSMNESSGMFSHISPSSTFRGLSVFRGYRYGWPHRKSRRH